MASVEHEAVHWTQRAPLLAEVLLLGLGAALVVVRGWDLVRARLTANPITARRAVRRWQQWHWD